MKRIPELDALRGIALFGILLVNVFVFHAPLAYYGEFYGTFEGAQADIVDLVVEFAGGKFLFIFAFLFGYGIVLQSGSRKQGFDGYFIKRMLVLLLFGVLHTLLFWFGDILAAYALLGLLMLPFIKLPDRLILTLGIFFLLFRPLYYLGVVYFGWPMIHTDKLVELPEYISIFQKGNYWSIFQFRMKEVIAFIPENLVWYLPKTYGLFFIGVYTARGDLFARIKQSQAKFIVVSLLFVLLPIFWTAIKMDVFSAVDLEETPFWRPALIGVNVTFETLLGFGYIFGFTLLFQKSEVLTTIFAKAGRMALTNYILQSLVCVFIFYGFGLGYYGKLLPSDLVLITIITFSFNLLFSWLYLKYRSQGPLEYVWRRSIGH